MSVQTAFHAALLRPDAPEPSGLRDGSGNRAGARYNVYRNNVAKSLKDALAGGFPAVQSLIGAENFAHVAGLFFRRSPPNSPILQRYGAGFPEFLEGFEPAKQIGYLGDVARLELAQRRAYHAGDAAPIDPALLQTMDEDRLLAARFTLAPAVQLLRSNWPVLSIYRFTMAPGSPKPQAAAEDVLIGRPLHDPILRVLPKGGADFITDLRTRPFGAALEAAPEGFDLPATLTTLLETGAICAIQDP